MQISTATNEKKKKSLAILMQRTASTVHVGPKNQYDGIDHSYRCPPAETTEKTK